MEFTYQCRACGSRSIDADPMLWRYAQAYDPGKPYSPMGEQAAHRCPTLNAIAFYREGAEEPAAIVGILTPKAKRNRKATKPFGGRLVAALNEVEVVAEAEAIIAAAQKGER